MCGIHKISALLEVAASDRCEEPCAFSSDETRTPAKRGLDGLRKASCAAKIMRRHRLAQNGSPGKSRSCRARHS